MLAHARETLRELRNVRQKLEALNNPTFQALQQDARAQLQALVPANFPSGVPPVLWQHLPRYLKALGRRLDKAPGNHKRDAELAARVRPAMRALEQLSTRVHRDEQHAEIARLQWLIEELRVSLFAQDLQDRRSGVGEADCRADRAGSGADFEIDALRERQLLAPVDRVGLAAHVRLPGVRARLAAAAGVLLAAERAADLGAGRADVDVRDAAVAARRRQETLGVLQPVGEDRRRQAVMRRRSASRSPRRAS